MKVLTILIISIHAVLEAQSGRISTERLRIMAELDCKLEKMSKVWKSSLKINLYGNSSLNYHSIQQQTE
nr:PREDICTED: uncharacterized protein LOC109034780 isoform X3 [Bemisia tabaci]